MEWGLKFDPPFIHASRPLTADERQAEDDDLERRTFVDFFGLDRLRVCRKIASEMMRLACDFHPETPSVRAKRRVLRKRLDKLAQIQFTLMSFRTADVNDARRQLGEMGVFGVDRG